eukprot:CAMPEP_0174707460 /NCGR_PEP_ID=MMETSP1094-20130205/9969_1 /TAXON_ID=156173 /ORGANISM="Chrysochromulina brevifilum, Strain UTEX LB 985" /LENGTH=79 /DNA_ID=CAMNT_0015905839 /DNA_START=797 /DNA_END=1036 /DNA_ORIENTATION=-
MAAGKTIEVVVEPSDKKIEIQGKIQEQVGIPPDQQRLLYEPGGREIGEEFQGYGDFAMDTVTIHMETAPSGSPSSNALR